MAVRVADNLKPANDSTEFPVAFGADVWIDKNKGSGTENYSSVQEMFNNDELGGNATQVDQMPSPSSAELGKVYQFIGATGTYTHGYFYECVSDGETPPTYSWEQTNVQPSNALASQVSYDNTTSGLTADDVQEAIDEVAAGLGSAAGKDYTDSVRPNSHELVESGSVYSAINNALSSIYTPRGTLACAELTASLLIEDNVGNVYEMSDSGITSSLFINGVGETINVGDNVGIIKAGANTYMFNLMGNAFDLTDYQKKELTNAVAGETTVEGALEELDDKTKKIYLGDKATFLALPEAERKKYDELHTPETASGESELQPKILATPLNIGGTSRTTVESALGALNSEKVDIQLKSNTDLNDIRTLGLYRVWSTTGYAHHYPVNNAGMVLVTSDRTDGLAVQQTFFKDCDPDIWTRAYNNGTWSDWQKLILESDLTPERINVTPTTYYVSGSYTVYRSGNVVTVTIQGLASTSAATGDTPVLTGLPTPVIDAYTVCYNPSGNEMRICAVGGRLEVSGGPALNAWGSLTYIAQ